MIVGFPRMQRLWPRTPSWVPLWMRPVREAEQAAQAAGASLWYVPPPGWADRSVNGPFVGSDGSGGVPAVGSGVVGWLRDASGTVGSERVPAGPWFAGSDAIVTAESQFGFTGSAAPGDNFAFVRKTLTGLTVGRTYRVSAQTNAIVSGIAVFRVGANISSTGDLVDIAVGTGSADIARVFTANATSTEVGLALGAANTSIAVSNISIREIPGSHATQSTSANRPVLGAAPGAAAAALGFAAPLFDSTDLLVAPLSSSGAPGYWDMLDNGAERTTPAAATTTTVTLQAPNTRQLLVAVAHPTAVPANVVTAARALANFMRGV